jgi:uncharacterized protein YndB with AHSA1/START domain
MQDRIEKTIDLDAPVSRVWRALTDHEEFGKWFRVRLDGPFRVGEVSTGQMTYPGYEHFRWHATVTSMEAERLFAFTWCPYSDNPDADYAREPTTLVEFRLEPTSNGTRLLMCESGFAALPDDPRRVDALRMNTEGWNIQAANIAAHVDG